MNGGQQEATAPDRNKLLFTLQQLLAVQAVDTRSALDQVSHMLVETMQADKIDVFLFNPAEAELVAMGVSDTPMGARQRQLGLDRLPLANGGREVEVYQQGDTYLSGNMDLDTGALPGLRYGLGVLSMVIVPLDINGERRGVVAVAAARSEAFTGQDVIFMKAVAHWVGLVAYRAQLVEELTASTAAQARQKAADELITVLAHELNNYLTPIQGRVVLLQRRATRDAREQDQADLAALKAAVDRLSGLVSDLLAMERLEQGLYTLHVQAVDLGELTRECVTTFATAERPIHLAVPDPTDLVVLADAARLRQVLENLLTNAVRHSPKELAVEVSVETEQQAEGRWATVSVQDHGSGIPAALVPQLFDRFAAGPDSNGLGLGLYMARRLAEAHSGTLTYDPSADGGACFRLALPLAESPAAA